MATFPTRGQQAPSYWNTQLREYIDEADATTDGDVTALDGRVTTTEGDVTALDGRVTTTEGDVTALDGRVTAVEDTIDTGRLSEASLDTDYARKVRIVVGAVDSDYTTIAAALAAVTPGVEIFLRPDETHVISGANIVPEGVRITGIGQGVTALGSGVAVIEGSYNTTVSALRMEAGSSIQGVHIRNTHSTGGGVPVAVDIRGAGVVVKECTFSGPFAQAILGYQSTDVRITDCTFDTVGLTSGSTPGDGINLFGVNGAVVSGCQFRDLKQNAIYVNSNSKNVTITGNTVRGGPEGMQVRVGCTNITIVGNTFDIKGASGITSFGIIVQTQCTDVVIANNTFRTTAGTATPIAAINVDDRCHRTIIDGNSIEGAGFAKGVLIQTTGTGGTESINTIITGNTFNAVGGFGIHVATNEIGVVIANNRLIGGTNKAILVQATRAVVSGNLVTSPAGTNGIEVAGSFSSVTGNVVTNAAAGAGILVTGSDNTITGNMCTGNATYGISETSNSNLITGNNVGGNLHATADINSTGAASKVAYNLGRYTQKGAA